MTSQVLASELTAQWLDAHEGIKVLSLDCFDTLFWRGVAEPHDLFWALASGELYRAHGLTAQKRTEAEFRARRIKWVKAGSLEVTLADIYREALPRAGQDEIDALMAEEIACEIEHGFIFQPVADLIRDARERGLKVIVVSDIYFSEAQLIRLLDGVMPGLAGDVDLVFCSSSYHQGKTGSIWHHVLAKLKVRPDQVLHLGDNFAADVEGAQRHGVRARHLVRHSAAMAELLTQRVQAALPLLPGLRRDAAVPCLYHGQLSVRRFDDPVEQMGYASLGPVLYAFARFLQDEIAALRAGQRGVRVAFLMRDGHLPSLACEALPGGPAGARLNISRFTATAASIDSVEKIQSLLARQLNKDNLAATLKQMLFPADEIEALVARASQAKSSQRELIRLVTEKAISERILARTKAFRERLLRHIAARTQVQPGEILVFVDLGYTGTARNLLEPILKREMNVDLVGRYLISAEALVAGEAILADGSGPRQRGLLDPAWVDPRTLFALTGKHIAAFEMMCTLHAGSTVGYEEDGEPILAETKVDERQGQITHRLQQACLQFIRDHAAVAPVHRPRETGRALRESAAIDLARLLYFPLRDEIDCITSFEFDFNLGTNLKMSVVDAGSALAQMRRSGLHYLASDLQESRMSYAMELRYLDVALSSWFFMQNRYAIRTVLANTSYRRESLSLLVASEAGHAMQDVEAIPTYDGFFAVHLPLAHGFQLALCLGTRYAFLQIDSVQRVASGKLGGGTPLVPGGDYVFEGIRCAGGNLYESSPDGILFFIGRPDAKDEMIRVVFRPLVERSAQTVDAAALGGRDVPETVNAGVA